MVSQQLLYGLPVSAKLLEVHVRLLSLYQIIVDDSSSLSPLDMLVFAILLQRTLHRKAELAFVNLRRQFPDWSLICDAPLRTIEGAICSSTWPEQKAMYLRNALRNIRGWCGALDLNHLFAMSDWDASAWLERLPGVGRKTSACVLLFSTLRRAILPVDTGHLRMMKRLGLIPKSIGPDRAHPILQALLPRDWTARQIEIFHNVVKRHAQTYCAANQPACAHCPLLDLCPFGQARRRPREEPKIHIATHKRRSSHQPHPLQTCMLLD